MNQCKHCGKEIPEGRKFCNHSCSAAYNNGRRKRKPWTEEQKKAIRNPREQRYCKHCGKPLNSKEFAVCKECNAYNFYGVFKKLGFQTGGLKERYLKAFNYLYSLYFEEKLSLPEIWKKTGIAKGTISRIFNLQHVSLRDKSKSQQIALQKGRKEIPSNYQYRTGIHISWQGQEYRYRSSWEKEYMEQLDHQKIKYLYEPFRIYYFDTTLKVKRVAVPDFYLPETNEIIELKSSWTFVGQEQCMKDKFKAYREAGYIPKLLLDWKIIDLGCMV